MPRHQSWRAFAIALTELSSSGARAPPSAIAAVQVIEHGLRHLAWLAEDDPTVRSVLNDSWRQALAGYVPEPFKHLG